MKEIITEKSIVRIHEGNLTEEQRKEVLANAVRQIICTVEGNLAYVSDSKHSIAS